MLSELLNKKKTLAVIGLGYVGLPIALEFARKMKVLGFDIKSDRVEKMKQGIDPSGEIPDQEFLDRNIEFTSDEGKLQEASFYIVAVPTPIDEHKQPDLGPLLSACRRVGKYISKGDYVVFESTVYPGCTEEECVPILEQLSGLKYRDQFKVGFSPERINPGDRNHTLTRIVKITSGCDGESTELISSVYETVISAGIFKASSIKVAEAAKVIENTQRDINIAFMNELSMIFNKMGINTYEVLEAARTKWNFLNFYPGLVGGHCIGVDPYYLSYKAKKFGHHAKIINSGREINDAMGIYVAGQGLKQLAAIDKEIHNCRILVMGITFKENVEDIRNSRVVDMIREFQSFGIDVDITDPRASAEEVQQEYGLELKSGIQGQYDAVILAVNHKEYLDLEEGYFTSICAEKALIIDIKGIYRGRINKLKYWSL